MPEPRLYRLVTGSTLHQLLGHQRAQDVQAVLGTRSSACAIAFTPIGSRAAAEQTQDGDGAGDGGDGADAVIVLSMYNYAEIFCTTTLSTWLELRPP